VACVGPQPCLNRGNHDRHRGALFITCVYAGYLTCIGIFLLNICLLLPLLTAWSNGLDSSMINGALIAPPHMFSLSLARTANLARLG
jgi:hypothetical protein